MTVSRHTVQSLPVTVAGGTEIDLRFVADSTVGVKLDYVRHKIGGNYDFVTTLDDPAVTARELDGRLWEVGYTVRPNLEFGDGVVSPKDATSFESWDVSLQHSAATALLFVWRGVKIPDAPSGDEISVSLLVTQDTNDSLSRWYAYVSRDKGRSVSIDHIEAPILWVKGPALPNGAETHRQGQVRTRVLLPLSATLTNPSNANNSSLLDWMGGTYFGQNPGPLQQLQFCAVTSMNNISTPDPAYRRVLHLGTEDTTGHNKMFRYEGYNYTQGGADDAYLRFTVRHFPSWTKQFGGEAKDDWGHSFQQEYPVVVGAYAAVDDYFYYDVCSFYRARMEALNVMPPKIESNPRLASLMSRKQFTFFPTIDVGAFQPLPRTGDTIYPNFLEIARILEAGLRSEFSTEAKLYLHLQSWHENAFNVRNPSINAPRSEQAFPIDIGVEKMIADARAEGMLVTGYHIHHRLLPEAGWDPTVPPEGWFILRNGNIDERASTPEEDNELDYGSLELADWWRDGLGTYMATWFDGIYYDSMGGAGTPMTYPREATAHVKHGGDYGPVAKRQVLTYGRALLDAHSGVDAPQLTEVAEETLVGWYDWVLPHHGYHPRHMTLAEATSKGAVTNISDEARDMDPDLWMMVYHEYQPTQQISFHFGNCLLSTNADWQPHGSYTGLSATEFVDLHCWLVAAQLASGSRSASVFYQNIYDGWDPDVNANGTGNNKLLLRNDSGLYVDRTKDPSGVGFTIMNFMRALRDSELRTHAGQFMAFGRYLRPIAVDHSSANVDTETNPFRVFDPTLLKVNPYDPARALMMPFNQATQAPGAPTAFIYSFGNFQVPAVLATMWQSPEGLVGLVLVNWTRTAADWVGTFNPANYGVSTPYNVNRLVLGGSPTTLASGLGAGAITIGTAASTPTVDVGTLAAHSVTVITFTT